MLRKIRSLVSNSEDFFGVYDNALTKKECEILINQFEKSETSPGHSMVGYYPEEKKCMELGCYFDDKSVISNLVNIKLSECMFKYTKKYLLLNDHLREWEVDNGYNFQRYDDETDGYKMWHCEHGPFDTSSRRIIAWMFYLNNAKSGTEFMHFSNVRAKMGRCVIWPSFWTHLHKGVTPNKGLKYIITGWASFIPSGIEP
tara:strand:- start:297 stop:896 length:600 start_codon:yes stop_codon:yes gene_type:complete